MGLATRLPPKYSTGGLKTFENFFSVGHTKCQVVGSSTMLAVITSNTLLTTTMPSRTLVPAPEESSHGLESSPVNKRPRGRPEANSESDSLPAARSKSSPPTINVPLVLVCVHQIAIGILPYLARTVQLALILINYI